MTSTEQRPAGQQTASGSTPTKYNPWLVLVALCLGFFMILLDTTIVNIAIPDMLNKLDASLDQILWVVNAYILVYAVLLITAGRLGDLYGPKRLFLGGLVLFTLASVACGFAQTPGQLVAARVAQGVGGALLTPQTLSLITMIFPPERRGAAFGLWGAVAGAATIAGPTLGGLIVTHWGWPGIFFVNLPIGIIALALGAVVVPDVRLNRRHRLDLTGTVLATAGLFLITYGLIEGEPHKWGRILGPITVPVLIAAGVLVLAAFLVQQYLGRNGEPLVPFAIFRDRNFALMNVVAAAFSFGMLGLFVPLVIFLQSVLGLNALQAGLTFAPMSLLSAVVAPAAGRLADRFGGKYLLVAGTALFAVGMGVVLASAHVNANRLQLLPGLIVAGFGLGLTFAPMQTIAMRNVAPRMAGAASGMINTNRQLGAVIGSAAVGALLQSRLAATLPAAARADSAALPPQARDQLVDGFTKAAHSGGLEIGSAHNGFAAPPGIPEQIRQAVEAVAIRAFHDGFTDAMRASLVLPIVVLSVAAVASLLVKPSPQAQADTAQAEPALVGGAPPTPPDTDQPTTDEPTTSPTTTR